MFALTADARRFAAALIIATAVMIFTRPFLGLFHDAMLYALQAQYLLAPEKLANDLFFVGGSQTSLSLFPHLQAALLRCTNLEAANWVGYAISRAAGLAAIVFFIWSYLPQRLRPIALIGVFGVSSVYGPGGNFGFAEAAFTARPVGEAFTILALALWIRGHRVWSFAVAAVGTLLHPIMGGVGVLVLVALWTMQVGRFGPWKGEFSRRLVVGAAAALIVAGAALFLPRMDSVWLDALGDRNVFAFVTDWTVTDFTIAIRYLLIAAVAARVLRSTSQTVVYLLTVVVGAFAIVLWAQLLLVDIVHVAFFTGLQLWRIQYLLVFMCALLLAPVVWSMARDGNSVIQKGALLLLAAVFAWPFVLGSSLLCLFTYAVTVPRIHSRLSKVRWLPTAMAAMSICVACSAIAHQLMIIFRSEPYLLNLSTNWLAQGSMFSALVVSLAASQSVQALLSRRMAPILAILCLVVSINFVDARSELSRVYDGSRVMPPPFATQTNDGELVYWLGRAELSAWFVMGRAGYDSHWQRLSAIFSKDNAIEVVKRRESVEALQTPLNMCQFFAGLMGGEQDCTVAIEDIKRVCKEDVRMATVVVGYKPDEPADGSFFLPDERKKYAQQQYWIFKCSKLRR